MVPRDAIPWQLLEKLSTNVLEEWLDLKTHL